jgi:hypothetical protein
LINNISTPLSNHTSFFVYWLVQCLTNIQSKEPPVKSLFQVGVKLKDDPSQEDKEEVINQHEDQEEVINYKASNHRSDRQCSAEALTTTKKKTTLEQQECRKLQEEVDHDKEEEERP